jgi:beta-lactamase class A
VELPAVKAQPVPPELTPQLTARILRTRLDEVAARYPGTCAIVVHDPSTPMTVALNADQHFLAGSLNKLPVLFTLYRAARG